MDHHKNLNWNSSEIMMSTEEAIKTDFKRIEMDNWHKMFTRDTFEYKKKLFIIQCLSYNLYKAILKQM